jgi:hypothetical protein
MYYLRNKKSPNLFNILQVCNETSEYNDIIFDYGDLPESVEFQHSPDLVKESKQWIEKIFNRGKPVVLLMSGGVDCSFTLECMIKNGFAPDAILVYTWDPYDRKPKFSPYVIEPTGALQYIDYKIKTTPILKKTELWHEHLDKKFTENFFSDPDWPIEWIGHHHSIDTASRFASVPNIKNPENYTFVVGGTTPHFDIKNNIINFYIVDKQFGDNRSNNSQNKCFDFILDDSKMFSAYCNSLIQSYVDEKNKKIVCSEQLEKFPKYLFLKNKIKIPEIKKISSEIPPMFDKRLNIQASSICGENSEDLLYNCNSNMLKTFLLYSEAIIDPPDWFFEYKKSFYSHEEWIKKCLDRPGILSKKIPLTFS